MRIILLCFLILIWPWPLSPSQTSPAMSATQDWFGASRRRLAPISQDLPTLSTALFLETREVANILTTFTILAASFM